MTTDPFRIFQGGKLKPGIYKIQNLHSETYLDVLQHSKEVCCRPEQDLRNNKGLIKPFVAGYTIQRIEPGQPEQFCTPTESVDNGAPLFVNDYPVAWRVEIVNDETYRGREYVRFYWGPTKKTWDLWGSGRRDDGAEVKVHDKTGNTWQIWRLNFEGPPRSPPETPGQGLLPSYDGLAAGQPCTHTQHTESENDTVVTVVTTTVITTRKRS